MLTGANRQLHGQSSQLLHSLNDTIGSHADPNTSKLTTKSLDSVNQIALAIEDLANKAHNLHFSTQKHTYFQWKE